MAIKVQGTTIIDDSRNIVNGIGASFTGIVTASSFSGSGSGLTGIGGTGEFIQDADGNLFAGDGAGGSYDPATGDACFNTFLGCNAGNSITSGDYNTFLGYFAGINNTSGASNVFIGREAGTSNSTTSFNIAIGQLAGCSSIASLNTFIGGFSPGTLNTTGERNVFIGGCKTGYCNTTGSCNIAMGEFAGHGNPGTGFDNIFLGTCVGKCITSGSKNFFGGYQTGKCNTTGSNNAFLGRAAGYCNTTGSNNTFLGWCAGFGGTGGVTGSNNTAIGQDAGKCLTSGAYNNFLGYGAGLCNTTGGCNNFLGRYAGGCNTTGCYNTFLGQCAGYGGSGGVTGNHNTAIGQDAGKCLTSGTGLLALGCNAGCCNTSGNFNIALGYYALRLNSTGSCNIALGWAAGKETTGSYNTFIGRQSGCTNTIGNCNIAIGNGVQLPSSTASDQLAIGSGTNRWIAGDSSFNVTIADKLQVNASGIVTASSGIITYYGDGSQLTGIQGGAAISTETSNQAQYIPYATSFGSTTGFGATTLLVYNPSTSSLGIGITNPTSKLHISGSGGDNVTVRATPVPVYVGSVSQTGGTSLTLTGLESGDLVLFMGVADTASVPTPQTDSVNWSVPPGITNNNTSAPYRAIFYNFATGSSITATFSSASVGYAMFAFRNVDSSTPFDVNATSTSTSGIMPDCPSITPVTNNSLIIAAGFLDDDQVASTTGAPTGYTLATAINNSLSQSTLMVAYKLLETAAAEDPGAFTDSSGSATDSYVADTLALRPAAPSNDFVIKSNGDVGIGTTNPLTKLHVVGVVSATSFYGDGSQLQNVGLSVTDDTSTNATRYILFDDTTSGSVSSINVSSTKLTYNPSTGELTSTLVTSSSDERLKENIRTIDDPLNKVLSLRGVEFDRIDNGDHQIGVIAQEVEKVIPQVVYGTDTKTVAYGNLVGLLIEAIKEQNEKIEEQSRKIEELESRIGG